ncbi:hypothetical protein DSM104299_02133 [Baekduia alba]|uniref:ADP-ribosylglycohydrolase family protein n=1 Tax=Baekduia alba TaxID=2997333 RepID=UPI00233FF5E5|nr:ADP-ribosylglycohydrolase family protein [Baekduia alba]WCB93420.1 hypothetical protein DSM104299_02133 [Baekduia alba]
MRLTWVQPEDLAGFALDQARQEGRDVTAQARRWAAAGGLPAPARRGASAEPAPPALRALAEELLDELTALPSPHAAEEPSDWDAIAATWPAPPPAFPAPRGDAELRDRLHGAWLGRAAGCLLGKPVEQLPRAGIREILDATGRWPLAAYFTAEGLPEDVARRRPWNRRSAPTSLAENIVAMPEDDDINFPMLALALLEERGRAFTTDDVAERWLAQLPAGRVFTAERVTYRNLLMGLAPARAGGWRNPFSEWIGAQIRADAFGWASPGAPAAAAELAWRDAVLSHRANGIYGALFVAAMTAAAPCVERVEDAIAAGMAVVPPASRMAAALRFASAQHVTDWEPAVDALYERYGDLHWVHAINNAALVVLALRHGDGDFTRSICAAVSAGWDTDSNGATVGAVVGALGGTAAIPDAWTAPLRNTVRTTLAGFDGIGFDALADRTLAVATVRGAEVATA